MMTLLLIKGLVVGTFIFMITMNIVANTKPLHGNTTGAISDKYPTLFTPRGFTFSIWGLIYLLLVLFVTMFVFNSSQFSQPILVGLIFSISSLCNGIWLNFWHQDKQGASSITMLGILLSLIMVYVLIQDSRFIIRLPISVYLGWISIATIAQLSILFYPYRPSSYKVEVLIFFSILILGVGLVWIMTIIHDDWIFALVYIWGYFGIYNKHKTLHHPFIERGILACISLIALIIVVSSII